MQAADIRPCHVFSVQHTRPAERPAALQGTSYVQYSAHAPTLALTPFLSLILIVLLLLLLLSTPWYYAHQALSRAGHADGSVAAGLMLVEGLGVEADEAEGLRYLQLRESVASAQGAYELGTAIYTGMALSLTATATAAAKIDGGPSADRKDGPEERVVEDPDAEAFAFFAAAAAAGHVGGAFMTADMLFSGEAAGGAAGAAVGDAVGSGGTTLCTDADADADLQRAVALFAQAADKGHRSARMRMRALFKHSE